MASPDGYGLSLEQAQGSVTLGRPLDIVVPIRGSAAGADADELLARRRLIITAVRVFWTAFPICVRLCRAIQNRPAGKAYA